ncbi:MAG TPA: DinB family protein [Candidatus Methylomirabilis sp.]|nr:DinB family protein [Candidatus Methylomirabilis sp.]
MLDRIEALTKSMAKSRTELLHAADSVTGEAWKASSGDGRWSAAELIAHLIQVERGVIAKADRIVQHPPRRIPLLKRLHLPIAVVEVRVVKRKSPVPLAPELLRDKEDMLGDLRGARERTLAFLAETSGRDLAEYYWPHPALGMLNVYGWMRFLGSHEIRHAKQLREIVHDLRKPIGNLQK